MLAGRLFRFFPSKTETGSAYVFEGARAKNQKKDLQISVVAALSPLSLTLLALLVREEALLLNAVPHNDGAVAECDSPALLTKEPSTFDSDRRRPDRRRPAR